MRSKPCQCQCSAAQRRQGAVRGRLYCIKTKDSTARESDHLATQDVLRTCAKRRPWSGEFP